MSEPTETGQPVYIDASGRAKATIVLLWITAGVAVLMFAGEIWLNVTLERIKAGAQLTEAQVELVDTTSIGLAILWFGLFVAAAIVFLTWVYRTAGNLRALGVSGLKFTPGWAVGWWFIPFANLFQSPRVMKELWQANNPAAGPDSWYEQKVPGLILTWWLLYIVGGVVSRFSGRMVENTNNIDRLISGVQVGMLGIAITLISNFLAIRMVRTIAQRQQQKAAVQPF